MEKRGRTVKSEQDRQTRSTVCQPFPRDKYKKKIDFCQNWPLNAYAYTECHFKTHNRGTWHQKIYPNRDGSGKPRFLHLDFSFWKSVTCLCTHVCPSHPSSFLQGQLRHSWRMPIPPTRSSTSLFQRLSTLNGSTRTFFAPSRFCSHFDREVFLGARSSPRR